MDFPSIQADVVTKVEPTKVNLVSHMYMISEEGCRPRGKSDLHFSDVTPTTMHTFIYLTLCMYSIENRILTIIYTTHGIRHKTLYHIHM
jgi:hypothetical protein